MIVLDFASRFSGRCWCHLTWYLKFRQRRLRVAPFHKLVEVWLQNRRWLFIPGDYVPIVSESRNEAKQFVGAQERERIRTVVNHDCQVSSCKAWRTTRKTHRAARCTWHSQSLIGLQDSFRWRNDSRKATVDISNPIELNFPQETGGFYICQPRISVICDREAR